MNRAAEEFGDYLMARGRIRRWYIIEAQFRDTFYGVVPGPDLRLYTGAIEHLVQQPKEDLPRELALSTNRLAQMYCEEKLKEA
jgi:hypothetical protein